MPYTGIATMLLLSRCCCGFRRFGMAVNDYELTQHCNFVAKQTLAGRVIPFLGAGVNLCGRPEEFVWKVGLPWLPSGNELADHLAKAFNYPGTNREDLLRVSQYATALAGAYDLYEKLRELFNGDYPPTAVHELLASVPEFVRRHRRTPVYQLIVTTNYDDLLERAFEKVGEPYDLVWYDAEGNHRGKFIHYPHRGEPVVVTTANEYMAASVLDRRTVILKIHGAVDRYNQNRDSFVITEDHYIEFLAREDVSNLIPAGLLAVLRSNPHFLFLGYSLQDWNLRVVLHRLWSEQRLHSMNWAIHLNPDLLEQRLWAARNVAILDVRLEHYVDALRPALAALAEQGAA
jgi:SIR2-like domain